jgi:hypothetical protein
LPQEQKQAIARYRPALGINPAFKITGATSG